MKKLLLLSSGTNACYHIAETLKEKFSGEFYIIGTDINDSYLVATSQYLDKFYKVPYTTDSCYYNVILKICQNEKPDYILPSFDADQKLFYPENSDLQKLGIFSFGTPKQTLPIYADKIMMNNFLQKANLPVPQRFLPTEIIDEKEYFIKPICGVGSIGAKKMYGRDLKKIADIEKYIIQEICMAPEYTLECFSYHNKFSAVCRQRIVAKSGVCVKACVFKNRQLEQIAKNFINTVKTPYYFNLQFMKNSQNQYVITDVNLRAAGGMSLSCAAGWDEVSALANIMLNRSDDEVFAFLPKNIPQQYVVRAYTDIVTKICRPTIAFDLDGTLLDSRLRHKQVMDAVLAQFGLKIDTSDLVEFKSYGKNNIDFLLSKHVEEKNARAIQQKWIELIENEEYLCTDKLYPDALSILEEYAKDNDLILLTARNNKLGTYAQLENLKIKKYFKEIFIVPADIDSAQNKAEILQSQNVVLLVGDTASDATAAKTAGIEFKFHENGFHKKEVIERR